MKTIKIISIFGILIFTANSCCMQKIGLYRKVPRKKLVDEKKSIMVNSAQIEKSYTLKVDGVEYSVCLNWLNRIIFISTYDSSFVTPEGLKTGMHLNDVLPYAESKLVLEPGFGNLLKLSSGWYADFGLNKNNMQAFPNDSTVKVFYRKIRRLGSF